MSSRRTFLKGCGALLPLPLLEALTPADALAAEGVAKRWGIFYFPHGGFEQDWLTTPDPTGAPVIPAFLEQAFGPIAGDLVWINGLDNATNGVGGHETASGTFLNCSDMLTPGPEFQITADQIVADQIGSTFPFRSLVLSAPGFQPAASCCTDVEIALNHISWRGGTTPATKHQDPAAVFDLIFSESDPVEAAERIARKRSILDFTGDQVGHLKPNLGQTDKQRLDDYLDSVRDVEARVELLGEVSDACTAPDQPPPDPNFEDHNAMMFDLVFLAFQCGLTPVATFMMDFEFSDRLIQLPGVTSGHHGVSHHEFDPNKFEQYRLIQGFYAQRFADFVQRMKGALDLDGESLLDSSMLVLCSGMNDGNLHVREDMPVVVAGGGGGQITPGRVIEADRPIADLWRTMMKAMGAEGQAVADFGNSPGELAELLT